MEGLPQRYTEGHLYCEPIFVCLSPLIPQPITGDHVATDGHEDLSRLEVSLTLTNKFEGLETDADHNSTQSLLLRWVWWFSQATLLPIQWSHSERTSYSLSPPLPNTPFFKKFSLAQLTLALSRIASARLWQPLCLFLGVMAESTGMLRSLLCVQTVLCLTYFGSQDLPCVYMRD